MLLLGWLYFIWCCHIFFTVKPDCIITGLQYILLYTRIIFFLHNMTAVNHFCTTIFNQFLPLMTQRRPSNDLYTKSASLTLHIIQEKEQVQFIWKRRCVIKLPGWWNKHFRGRFNNQICPNLILEVQYSKYWTITYLVYCLSFICKGKGRIWFLDGHKLQFYP